MTALIHDIVDHKLHGNDKEIVTFILFYHPHWKDILMIYLKLIRESYLFAVRELVVNKTRTFLSLLGITIGIFAIISVFTIFDSLEKQLRDSVDSMGSNVLYISKESCCIL